MDENRVIGIENRLPWHLPADMKHFRTVTMGKPMLMGRKTFESIGKALPGRINMVVTRDATYQPVGCSVFQTIEKALREGANYAEVMVIGGASFYRQMLPLAQRLYITLIRGQKFEGDAYFPKWNSAEWKEISRTDHDADASNAYSYSFIVLERTT